MVGQKRLLSKLKSYTISTLPHSILLLGERGSEDEEVINFISSTFSLPQHDITSMLNKEIIDDIYSSMDLGLYIIHVNEEFNNVKQNMILKFFEEPNAYTYIIIVSENDSCILDTIKTRSYIMRMDGYSREQLATLSDNELVLKVCSTPGQIKVASLYDVSELYKLCNNLVDLIKEESYPAALSLSGKINFKDEYDKYDLYLFLKMLRLVLLERRSSEAYMELLQLTTHIFTDTYKQQAFEHFITQLWAASRGSSLSRG